MRALIRDAYRASARLRLPPACLALPPPLEHSFHLGLELLGLYYGSTTERHLTQEEGSSGQNPELSYSSRKPSVFRFQS